MKEKKEQTASNLEDKLLESLAVISLKQEFSIYNKFKEIGWRVEHSPYYLDTNSGKFREVDITARKYWSKNKKGKFSFGVNFIIECKSMTNYHIVACNQLDNDLGSDLENDWIGNDATDNYPRTIKLLQKHEIKPVDIQETLKLFHKHLFPNMTIRYLDYRLDAFEIPVFCAFRETNIGTTIELENSVVWKAYQSLYSVIRSYQESSFDDIDYEIFNIENEKYLSTYESKLEELRKTLILDSNHFEIFHPILVVESKLWELKNDNLEELKYFRLLFHEMSSNSTWIDIVDFNHLDEYIENIKLYDEFFIEKQFKN
jgi:hypothetical protein